MKRHAFLAVAAACLLAGCIDTDPAVFVEPAIDSPELVLTQEALGVALAGSFQLTLHLGARASGESQVSYASFTLVDDAGDVVIDNLPVTASAPSPVTVEPGGADTAVLFDIDSGPDLLPLELAAQLCGGLVTISAVLEDSLATTSTSVESEPFAVACE